ncbi:hypothetical protein P154DRAFT_582254 [Amniculicola lignicola CBS 123094]|uniref:BTB domain-containing protein n=1 Tax=Amniculicola lignicola CBS 123094 TaxID=1392246 RepID=A0A6A5VW15_9PLEO|nr:hypothetical protein P154DRAFT_582254 [Amniculicola lignicola CBS 123094]
MGITAAFQWWFRSSNAGQKHPAVVDLEACSRVDTSTWPPPTICLINDTRTDPLLCSLKSSTEFLDIKIGATQNARRWKVHKALICHYSEHFQLRSGSQSAFDLGQYNPNTFKLFLDWLYRNSKRAHDYRLGRSEDPMLWKAYASEAYILGTKLLAPEFTKFAFGMVIQYANLLDVFDMESVYEETQRDDPLRLFAGAWARWRCLKEPTLWESSHNADFQHDRHQTNQDQVKRLQRKHAQQNRSNQPDPKVATPSTVDNSRCQRLPTFKRKLNGNVQAGPEVAAPSPVDSNTRDPRGFLLDHWYSVCAQDGGACDHFTIPIPPTPTSVKIEVEQLPRTWEKRQRHKFPVKATTLTSAMVAAYGSQVVTLGILVLAVGLINVIAGVLTTPSYSAVTAAHVKFVEGFHSAVVCRAAVRMAMIIFIDRVILVAL